MFLHTARTAHFSLAHLSALLKEVFHCDFGVRRARRLRASHSILAVSVRSRVVLHFFPCEFGYDFCPCAPTLGLGGEDVDDGVPEALQREDDGGYDVEAEVLVLVDELVEPVDGAGDPDYEEGDEH